MVRGCAEAIILRIQGLGRDGASGGMDVCASLSLSLSHTLTLSLSTAEGCARD